jgi:glycosyltransferase involved in cell wall biosynthesis
LAQKVSAVAGAFRRRAGAIRHVNEFDAVYVFREAALLGPAIIERMIARSRTPMVFDFDDAVFEPYVSPSNGYLSLLKFPGKTATVCRLAAHVMAGNEYLAEYARRRNPRVTVVPTTIDTDRYHPRSTRSNDGPIVIGWSGSYSTVQHLRRVDVVLQRLAKVRDFRLRVIGTSSYPLDGVAIEAMPWSVKSEIDDLSAIDIGIMPLPDDRWSRGKCGLKALQYMSLGIPTMCSPVGVNTAIISHGENGMLAASDDDWVDGLTRLIDCASLRARLGRAGRVTAETRYSASVQAPIVRDIFKSLAP